jgi:predicted nucleic acid-binding protein
MLVVADTSPFIGLLKINHLDVLPRLYGAVAIPTEVAAELSDAKRPADVRAFIASPPAWLTVCSPSTLEDIPDIDAGERAAISLARELKADILLIDERTGREAAIARNIRTLRTTALLLDAAKAGVVSDLRAAYEKLAATNFRVNRKTLEELLTQYEEFRKNPPGRW